MEEILDIVDEMGDPTGQTVTRGDAHRYGVRHRTSHVWILRKNACDRIEILLQKRSDHKDSYPGCYDISSAGHIPAGVDFIPSALRELQEELGVKVTEEELIYAGQRHFVFEEEFYGEVFKDNQVSNVYILWLDQEIESFVLQEEEVSGVCWMELDDCIKQVKENRIPHCIFMEELFMVKEAAEKNE